MTENMLRQVETRKVNEEGRRGSSCGSSFTAGGGGGGRELPWEAEVIKTNSDVSVSFQRNAYQESHSLM